MLNPKEKFKLTREDVPQEEAYNHLVAQKADELIEFVYSMSEVLYYVHVKEDDAPGA